jgi:hypothetical protein
MMRARGDPVSVCAMPEGLSAAEVGKEIAEHRKHTHSHEGGDRALAIVEAVLLAVVALLAAWSGYAAAKWSTESSVSLSKASATRTKASRADLEGLQIRTIDAVEFNTAFGAYLDHNAQAFRLAVRRLRPGYRVAFDAWLATHPIKNPNAPRGPAYMPQYVVPHEAEAKALDAQGDRYFADGREAGQTGDKYVRITVFLATVLFLLGISSHFPRRGPRGGLIVLACGLLTVAVVQLGALPGLP